MYATKGSQLNRLCRAAFMKHVLPRFARPTNPAQRRASQSKVRILGNEGKLYRSVCAHAALYLALSVGATFPLRSFLSSERSGELR